jgi:hypothetical protein
MASDELKQTAIARLAVVEVHDLGGRQAEMGRLLKQRGCDGVVLAPQSL